MRPTTSAATHVGPRWRPSRKTFGDRIQKSVFIITVASDELPGLQAKLLAKIDPDEDSIYLVPLCRPCYEGMACLGQASPPTQELFWAVL